MNLLLKTIKYFLRLNFGNFLDEGSFPPSLEAKVMYIFNWVLEFTILALPFAVCFLLMVDPCTPPFLLSFSQSCAKITWISGGWEILVVLFEACVALQALTAAFPCVCCLLFGGIVAILDYFHVLKR